MTQDPNDPDLRRRLDLLRDNPYSADLIRGSFFADGVVDKSPRPPFPLSSDFENFGNEKFPWQKKIRYLPTSENIACVLKEFGDSGSSLMLSWRSLFDGLPNGLESITPIDITYPDDVHIPHLRRLSDRTADQYVSRLLFNNLLAIEYDKLHRRSTAQHILEDAIIAVTTTEAGLSPVFQTVTGGALRQTEMVGVQLKPSGCEMLSKKDVVDSAFERRGFQNINPYWRLQSFRLECGRWMVEAFGLLHLCTILYDMALQGRKKAFVKHCVPKNGTWIVDLSTIDSPLGALHAFTEACGMSIFDLTAHDAAPNVAKYNSNFIVQEFKPFELEHRFFIVDGRIAASTPSDRALSVLDAIHGVRKLDPRVAVLRHPASDSGPYDRGETHSRTDRAAVAAMARKVRTFLRAAFSSPATSYLLPRAFVIDAGIGPDGCGLIEMNTFMDAGIYALDYRKVAMALARPRIDRRSIIMKKPVPEPA